MLHNPYTHVPLANVHSNEQQITGFKLGPQGWPVPRQVGAEDEGEELEEDEVEDEEVIEEAEDEAKEEVEVESRALLSEDEWRVEVLEGELTGLHLS